MTTSRTPFLDNVLDKEKPLSAGHLAYFRERQRNRLYRMVVSSFERHQQKEGWKKADIARRLGKDPAQITRWLANPGNWTLDTVSDLMLAIGKGEVEFRECPLKPALKTNGTGMDIFNSEPAIAQNISNLFTLE